MSKDPGRQPPVIVGKAYDLTLWLLQKVESFPRSSRYGLGERINDESLGLLLTLVEAAYSPSKGELLRQAGRRLQALRYLTRLAKDLRLVSVDAYGFAAERADEIGRMMGGWQKQQEGRT